MTPSRPETGRTLIDPDDEIRTRYPGDRKTLILIDADRPTPDLPENDRFPDGIQLQTMWFEISR